DFDWKQLLRALIPEAVEVKLAGQVYYKIPVGKAERYELVVGLLGPDVCYYVPDGRTVVFNTEENVRRQLGRKPGDRPARPWAEEWKRIDRGLLAVILDNRNGSWSRELAARKEPGDAKAYFDNVSWITYGINAADDFVFQGLARSETEKQARKLAR